MLRRVGLIVALLAASAYAKPLPDGLKVFVDKGRPMASKSGMIVPLRDDSISDYDRLLDAHLSDDGASIQIRAERCHGMLGEPDDSSVSLAKVLARIDNALGMAKHLKKEYADAIPHFAAAVAKDPDTTMYATNLLSAQSLAKKFDDADQTIATLATKNPAWLAWRLAVDPELANVKPRPSAKAVVAAKAGRVKSTDFDTSAVAYSPLAGGLVAIEVFYYTGGGPPGGFTEQIGIASLASGQELVRLPIRDAANRKLADSLLASLGFDKTEAERKPVDDVEGVKLEITDDMVTATRGKTKKTFAIYDKRVKGAAVLPQGVIFDLDRRHLMSCDDQGGVSSIGALALP
jgi:hypothetical protein